MASTRSSLSRSQAGSTHSTGLADGSASNSQGARHASLPARQSRRRAAARAKSDMLVGAVIAGYALLVYLPYDVRTSFLLDDYTMIEHFRFGTWLPTYRPTFKLEMDVTNYFFGDTPHGYYVLLGVLAAAVGVLLFGALRSLGLSVVPAAIAGALIVAYPRADAVTLWWSSSSALALCLGLGSVWMGSLWMRRTGRALGLLVPSLTLMAASVLCYESIFPLFLLMLCFFPLSARRRRLLGIAAMEGATACVAALYMFVSEAGARNALPVSAYAGRIRQLVISGLHAYSLGGVGAPMKIGLLAAAGVVVAMAVALAASGPSALFQGLEPLGRLLMAVPLLAVAAFVSLVPFIPAPAYYIPQGVGTANRVNALPQVFIVTAIGIIMWVAARVASGWRHPGVAAVLAAAASVVVVGASVGSVHQDESGYLAAAHYRNTVLTEVRRLVPSTPASGSVIFIGDYVQNMGPPGNPAYPTIQNEWDASATLQLMYGAADFSAWTLSPATQCRATSVFSALLGTTTDVPYPNATIIDIAHHRVFRFSGQKKCLADLPRMTEPT